MLFKELASCLTTFSTFAAGAYPQFEATLVTAYKNANGIIMGAQPAVASPAAPQDYMSAWLLCPTGRNTSRPFQL